MHADPTISTHSLSSRPPRSHGLNAEFVVFELLGSIESSLARVLPSEVRRSGWSIIQRLFSAHLTGRELHFADLWLEVDQSEATIRAVLDRLILSGLATEQRAGSGTSTRLELTPLGAERLDRLAQEIGAIMAIFCARAGRDPFAPINNGASQTDGAPGD